MLPVYVRVSPKLRIRVLSYSIEKKLNLIPEHFTKAFIFEAASFVMSNNNFQFDIYVLQLAGTAMGMKFTPHYVCLTVGYLEETLSKIMTLTFYIN